VQAKIMQRFARNGLSFNINRLVQNNWNLSKNIRKKVNKKGIFFSQLQCGVQ